MELKKSPHANLENKRKIFIELGLVIAIAICLFSFRSATKVKPIETFGPMTDQVVEDILIPITKIEEVKPEPPPPPKVADLILLVDNSTEITDDLIIEDSGADNKTAINAVMHLTENKETDVVDEQIFIMPQEMPEFPGGYLALLKYFSQNIRYPVIAAENGITGKVTINFIVNKDGSISDAKIIRGVDQSIDKEALRVVNSLPKWKPGKQAGKEVRVSYSVPINFVLQ